MSNQINSKNAPKNYDAGDMVDAYSLAECRSRHYSDEAEAYQAEFDANKKAVTL